MKQVFFSAASVLLLILISSAIAFNPLTVRAQMELAPPDASATQILNPAPIDARKELINTIPVAQTPPDSIKTFEELHKDKNIIFEIEEFSVKVNKDFSYQARTKKRVRILNDSVISALGELTIPYDSSKSRITSLKAHTIAPDGTVYPCSQIQDLSRYNKAMYSDTKIMVATFSHVTVGSRLEYEAVIDYSRGPIKDTYFEDYYFNFTAPIKELNVSFTIPKALAVAYKEYNLSFKPEITQDKDNVIYSWHMVDMYEEPLREDMLPVSDDRVTDCFQFSSIKSWDDVSVWYYSLIQKNLIITPEIASLAEALTKDKFTTREKTRAILEHIQKDFRYVAMNFGDNGLEPHPTTEVFYNKYGDCKDLSLLCVGLLRSAGIDSSVALFNTEDSITDPSKDLPFPTTFDHVLLLVRDPKEGDFFVDPLLDGYDIGQYPLYYQNAFTFVIGKDKGEFKRFPIFSKERSYEDDVFTVDIKPDGSAITENRSVWSLDFSIRIRRRYKSMSDEEKDRLFEYMDDVVAAGGQLLERRVDGLDATYGPLISHAKVFNKDKYPITDNMIIIDLAAYERPDDFTSKERQNPIFYPYNSIEKKTVTYKLPKGFKISHMPQDIDLDNGYFSVKRSFEAKKNTVIVTEIEEYKRMELPVESYESLREFCDSLPKKTRQRIVLTRKKPFWSRILGR